jgi:hypothetical protein
MYLEGVAQAAKEKKRDLQNKQSKPMMSAKEKRGYGIATKSQGRPGKERSFTRPRQYYQ